MNICIKCNGTGYNGYYDQDEYRYVSDPCYHCGTLGHVDDDTAYGDKIYNVALTLAYLHVTDMCNARNSDPDGEGWDFYAAENMLSGSDYFTILVDDYAEKFLNKLYEMTSDEQKLLIAWNEMPTVKKPVKKAEYVPKPIVNYNADCDIPF